MIVSMNNKLEAAKAFLKLPWAIVGVAFWILVLWALIAACSDHTSTSTSTTTAVPSATDTHFLDDLKWGGVTYTTPEHAISTAHEICNKFASGSSRAAVEDFYTQQREWRDPLMLISIAIAQYCPQYLQSGPPERSYPSVTATAAPITPPPGAQHSSVAGVYLPPSADLDPSSVTPQGERWDIPLSYPQAVAQQEALLPVGQSLDGHPWCQKTPLPGSTDNTTWIWGRPRDAIDVSVFTVSGAVWIVVRHTTEASLYCK
jgi:hypothetical protein